VVRHDVSSYFGDRRTAVGYATDFIGHVDIEPMLNDDEMAYLQAFTSSRRYARPGGPYDVPPNPAADHERADDIPVRIFNEVAPGQPGLHCDWVPCWEGCCLAHRGVEKLYDATAWMRYLIDHFLRPGAHAAESGLARFDNFTFDHRCNGIIAGCRRDDKKLFLIRVQDNEVSEEVLRRADSRLVGRELLAYEAFLDRQKQSRSRVRRKRRSADGRKRSSTTTNVVSLRPSVE
jgi:hypothetical protein